MASTIDISAALKRLTDTLPPPRGVSMDKAFNGYVTALQHFAAAEIDEAIERYLAAEFPDVSLKFYPRAPELAGIIRLIREEKARASDKLKRAEVIQRQIAEGREIEQRCRKTPEQLDRGRRIYEGFLASRQDVEAEERRLRVARERAEIRARYGMTAEALAGVKDVPAGKPRQFQDKDFGGLA
jgi:hypothetical protein